MPKIIRNFLLASALTGLYAGAACAAEASVAQAVAHEVRDSVPAQAAAPQSSAAAEHRAAKRTSPVPEASNWSMLLVGAGVLLLRRRRQNNKFD